METKYDLSPSGALVPEIKIEEAPLPEPSDVLQELAEGDQWFECEPDNFKNKPYFCATTVETYKCRIIEICEFESNLKVDLLKHSSTVHKLQEFSYNFRHYRCTECNFVCFSEFTLENHTCSPKSDEIKSPENQKKFTNGQSFECEDCSFKSRWKHALRRHVLLKHANPETVDWLKCDDCSFRTLHKDHHMHKHRMKHMGPEEGEWFECEHCPFKSRWKNSVKKHVLLKHTKPEAIKWLECDECPYRATEKSHMDSHKAAQHLKPEEGRWFDCEHCSYRSRHRGNLKSHKLHKHISRPDREREVKVKMLECEHCPYKTGVKSSMDKHKVAKHLKPEEGQWFECTICGYKSRQKYALKTHLLRMHMP